MTLTVEKKMALAKKKKTYLKYVDMHLKTCQTPPNTVHFFRFTKKTTIRTR